MTRRPDCGDFIVLLGPDYTGKSTALRALAARGHPIVAGDDERFPLLGALRRLWLAEVLPNATRRYSAETAVSVLHPLVVHMHEQIRQMIGVGPVIVDSYYYKLLAKLRLLGMSGEETFAAWRRLPQPAHVVRLDADPAYTWERTRAGADLHAFEHYGDTPTRGGFVRFQNHLRTALSEEVRGLPVTLVDATRGIDAVVAATEKAGRNQCERVPRTRTPRAQANLGSAG